MLRDYFYWVKSDVTIHKQSGRSAVKGKDWEIIKGLKKAKYQYVQYKYELLVDNGIDKTRKGTKDKPVDANLNNRSATSVLEFNPLELQHQYVDNKMINKNVKLIHN